MLGLEPFNFAYTKHNWTATPSATPGTACTAGASNADGTAVTLLSALSQDAHYLMVGFSGYSASAADCNALADILIDPAGGTSWSELIDSLTCGFTPVLSTTIGVARWYHFPLWIPSGASIGCRIRNARAATTAGQVHAVVHGGPSKPERWWCGQKVESLGINAASSKGTNITPGNSGSYGSWTTIGTSTYRYGAIQFGINGTDGTAAAISYYFEIGYGSTRLPGSPHFHVTLGTAETIADNSPPVPIWCDIPPSTVMQARGVASGTAEVHNVAFYGVY